MEESYLSNYISERIRVAEDLTKEELEERYYPIDKVHWDVTDRRSYENLMKLRELIPEIDLSCDHVFCSDGHGLNISFENSNLEDLDSELSVDGVGFYYYFDTLKYLETRLWSDVVKGERSLVTDEKAVNKFRERLVDFLSITKPGE